MSNKAFNWTHAALLTLAAACWGAGTVMTKGALQDVPAFTLPVVQLAASSAFLWLVVLSQRLRFPPAPKTARLALTGLLEPGFTITFAVLGLKLTTASMATLIFAVQPALVLLLAWWMLGERLSRPILGLALVAVLGVGLVSGVQMNGGSWQGNLLVIGSLICCSIYLAGSRRWVVDIHPVLLVALQQTVGLVWTLVLWPIELLQTGLSGLAVLSPGVWLLAGASGVVYYALGFWFYISGLKHAPAGLAAMFLSLTPIFGVGAASLFLGESLAPVQWLGAAVILAAVLGLSRPQVAGELQPSAISHL